MLLVSPFSIWGTISPIVSILIVSPFSIRDGAEVLRGAARPVTLDFEVPPECMSQAQAQAALTK
eukprot:SAG31_NODE_44547_length_262_cov_0.883436_1_plen_63_part_10